MYFLLCVDVKKKEVKNHYSKGEEIAMFLFNKLDSLLALFEDSVIASGEGRLSSVSLSLNHVQTIHMLFQIMMYLYQYFHTFYQERNIRNIVKLKYEKNEKANYIFMFFQFLIALLEGSTKKKIER